MLSAKEHPDTAEFEGDALLGYIAAAFAALTIILPGVVAVLR